MDSDHINLISALRLALLPNVLSYKMGTFVSHVSVSFLKTNCGFSKIPAFQ